jgi:hypothetical protein
MVQSGIVFASIELFYCFDGTNVQAAGNLTDGNLTDSRISTSFALQI